MERWPEGEYRLERVSGLLPPLAGVRKRVRLARGETRVGPIPLPFELRRRGDAVELRYRGPLRLLVDELRPADDGAWDGRATVAGREYGRFRMLPVAPSG